MVKIISANSFNINTSVVPSGTKPTNPTTHNTLLSTELQNKINSFNFAGVYQITSVSTDECLFIGASANITKRIHQHISGFLNNSDASNLQLRQHYNKFGINDFDFKVLEKYTEDEDDIRPDGLELFKREKYYIDLYEPSYNITAYNRRISNNKKYTLDRTPTEVFINSKALNIFGKPMVYPFSIDHKTGYIKAREVNKIDERRKTWTPTYVTFVDDNVDLDRGDNTNFKAKPQVKVVETVVIRKNPFGNGR